MSTFGKRLRQAREKKGLTQVQLAKLNCKLLLPLVDRKIAEKLF